MEELVGFVQNEMAALDRCNDTDAYSLEHVWNDCNLHISTLFSNITLGLILKVTIIYIFFSYYGSNIPSYNRDSLKTLSVE